MFRLLRFLIWTGCAVALGAWMATARVAGATPMQHLSRLWERTPLPEKVETAKGRLQDELEDAKDALSSAKDHQVRERHSEKDREAVNRLIAKRGAPK